MSDEPPNTTSGRPGVLLALRWACEALMLQLLWGLVTLMPVDRASATGRRIMAWIGPRTAKHRHVLANLRMVCPQCSHQDIERLATGVWGNIGAVFAEFTKLPLLTDPRRNQQRLEMVYTPAASEVLRSGNPCVFVSAHLANWEMLGYAVNRAAGAVDVIYNPQPNPWLEKIVQKRRRVLGCGYVGKVNSVRRFYNLLQHGRSVGLMVDVRVDGGASLPFCGADASVTTTPAWLSLKTGCAIVPVQVERIRDARYRVTFHAPLRSERGAGETRDDAILRTTRDINARVETWVKAHPGEWWCTKRRWPKDIMKQRGAYSDAS
ncbi:MAG: lysophospholipid acyltransferase family protein [Thiogranum sp.]|nr:lysophospholipid acyltransferase family protein [Thiogranum sp.]